jgi:hypothetical protein
MELMTQTAPAWRFRPHTAEERASDDFSEELFRTSRNTNLAESIVRESIQNSLDAAKTSSNQVRVRFAIKSVPFSALEPFLGDLMPRLESPDLESISHSGTEGDVRVLTVEDFGTVGLEGDPARHDDPDRNSKDRFWEFWRNLGRGNRGEARRGRWGLGKSVFHIASDIGTYFGLTVRSSDNRSLAMGMSQLKVHYLADQRYESYGYYGVQDSSNFTHPDEDTGRLDYFSDSFNISRSGDPGLSLAIPYCNDEIDSTSLIDAAVSGYFFPLLTGELTVTIEEGDQATTIDRAYVESLDSIAGLNDGVIEMARFAITNTKVISGLMIDPPRAGAPRWSELEFNEEKLEQLSDELSSVSMVEIEVPVFIHPWSTQSVLTSFRVILREEPDRSSRSAMFIRNGVTITEVKHSAPRGFSALVITDEESVSEFLGDSENPAHTAWKSNTAKFGQKYKYWPSTIDYVAGSPFAITEQLSSTETAIDRNLFSDLFFVDTGEAKSRTRKKPTVKKAPVDVTNPPTVKVDKGTKFITSRIGGGFQVVAGDLCPPPPFRLRTKMAYESKTSRSSTKNWNKFDFDLKDTSMNVGMTSATIVEKAGQTLIVDISSTDFKITVTGFDTNRDLFVAPPRTIEIAESNE